MEIYTTEEEQLNAIRRFIKQYGKWILVSIVIVGMASAGWRYWKDHQTHQLLQASTAYEQIMVDFSDLNSQNIAKITQFIKANHNSYGVFAALKLAQHFVDTNNFAQAEQQLTVATSLTKDENLTSLSAIRLARVQTQEKKYDLALKSLALVKGNGWTVQKQILQGDILLAKGDASGAKIAYRQGLSATQDPQLLEILNMKLNNLSD